jgi:hypothetical protein
MSSLPDGSGSCRTDLLAKLGNALDQLRQKTLFHAAALIEMRGDGLRVGVGAGSGAGSGRGFQWLRL